MYSLFIGRWQPFHDGHKALIETALNRGKDVCIGIRDTPLDDKNPFTIEQRKTMILKALSDYWGRVEIIVVPNIDEVLYGRDVGYKVEQIHLAEDLEAISGTKTREATRNGHLDNRG